MRAPVRLASPAAIPVALVGAYIITRLLQLDRLPMVSDEGTYLTWGVRALHATSMEDWLASLEDGKQPLLAWLMPPLLAVVPDRLIAGRLTSVFTGLANVLLLARLGSRIYGHATGRVTGWMAAALYILAPVALVHDRMALYESLVTTGALVVLWTALAWADRPSAGQTVLLGLALGAALLTKLSAVFFVALAPAAIALWQPRALRRAWPLAQAYFVAAAVYSVLYISPIVGNIQEGNFLRYSLTTSELLELPLLQWRENATFVAQAAGVYLGWPLALLALSGLALGTVRGSRGDRVAVLWTVVPLVCLALTAKIIYSRYVVFCFVTALLPAARLLVMLTRVPLPAVGRWAGVARAGVGGVLGTLAVLPGVMFAVPLLLDPPAAPWMNDPRYITDRFQYVESNYAGYGLREIVAYLRERAQSRPIVVLTRNITGMPRDGVSAYLLDWPQVELGFVQENESIEDRLRRQPDRTYQLAAQGAEVYYILTDAPHGEQERRFRSLNPGLMPVMEIAKPGNHSRFQLYQTHWRGSADDTWLAPPPRLGARAGEIVLRGFQLSTALAMPEQSLRLTLYWEAEGRPARDYTVFNHLVDGAGTIWGQNDGQPAKGQRPTSRWRPRESVPDVHEIVVKPGAPPGAYELVTGMYELQTLRRVPVQPTDGTPPSDRIVLGRITIGTP